MATAAQQHHNNPNQGGGGGGSSPLVSIRDCATSNYPRPTKYDDATWKFLQDTYRQTMNNPMDVRRLSKDRLSGMEIPYKVQDDPTYGRGVYATAELPKGTTVWTSQQNARFTSKEQFLAFLSKLPYNLQCEILLWAYPMGPNAYVELDDGSFINHAVHERDINLSGNAVTKRTIRPGEQLLMNYNSFITYGTCPWFDEIRAQAWKTPTTQSTTTIDTQQQGPTATSTTSYRDTNEYNRLGSPNARTVLNQQQSSSESNGHRLLEKDPNRSNHNHYSEQRHMMLADVTGGAALVGSLRGKPYNPPWQTPNTTLNGQTFLSVVSLLGLLAVRRAKRSRADASTKVSKN